MPLLTVPLDDLLVRDEDVIGPVWPYGALKAMLRRDGVCFRVLSGDEPSWARALLLNLTWWSADAPSDVLMDGTIDADVIMHVGWHHASRMALHADRPATADALLLGEAIASSFDLFLVGALIARGSRCGFLDTQVPAMAEVAREAGMPSHAFEALLHSVASDPEGAFEELRRLLFDVTTALVRCGDVDAANEVLEAADDERLSPLLHHYALSAWVSSARQLGDLAPDPIALAADAAMRGAPSSLAWLGANWLPGQDPAQPIR